MSAEADARVYEDHIATCPDCGSAYPGLCPEGDRLWKAWLAEHGPDTSEVVDPSV